MASDTQLSQYGQVVARLARPLADRDAVLWLVRLDDTSFAALERECLNAIAMDTHAAATFARAYAGMHALLLDREGSGAKGSAAKGSAAPATIAEAAIARAQTMDTLAALDTGENTLAMSEGELAAEDAMFTLASTTQVASPRRRQSDEDP